MPKRFCIRAWGKGGYYPFTWFPMLMLAREQIAAKRAREGRAEKAIYSLASITMGNWVKG